MADFETRVRRSRRRHHHFVTHSWGRSENDQWQRTESERVERKRRCNDAELDRLRMERTEAASNGEFFVTGYIPAWEDVERGTPIILSTEELDAMRRSQPQPFQVDEDDEDDRYAPNDYSFVELWVDMMCDPNRISWGELTGLAPDSEPLEDAM